MNPRELDNRKPKPKQNNGNKLHSQKNSQNYELQRQSRSEPQFQESQKPVSTERKTLSGGETMRAILEMEMPEHCRDCEIRGIFGNIGYSCVAIKGIAFCPNTGKREDCPLKFDEENAELKLELIAARSRLVDVEKALKYACEFFDSGWDCPIEFDDESAINICLKDDCNTKEDSLKCWERYWMQKARGGHD